VHCPFCDDDNSKVIDSRESGDGIRRRRECIGCGTRFTTYERVEMRELMVVKRDGRREEFKRDKLWDSVTKACAKRPLPLGRIEKVINEIQSQLSEAGRAEVSSKDVGELVMDRLKAMDRVAYIRYASVYREFRDIESFKSEIDALLEPSEPDSGVPTNQLPLSMLDEDTSPLPRRRRRGTKRPKVHPA
jgi:transcriptional repressor NrdR